MSNPHGSLAGGIWILITFLFDLIFDCWDSNIWLLWFEYLNLKWFEYSKYIFSFIRTNQHQASPLYIVFTELHMIEIPICDSQVDVYVCSGSCEPWVISLKKQKNYYQQLVVKKCFLSFKCACYKHARDACLQNMKLYTQKNVMNWWRKKEKLSFFLHI